MTERAYENNQIRAFKRQANALEAKYAPLIESALNSQIEAFLAYAEDMGINNALLHLNTIVLNKPVEDVLRRLYITEGRIAGRREEASIKDMYGEEWNNTFGKQAGTPYRVKAMDFFTDWLSDLTNFFNYQGFNSVVRISNTTRDWLRRQASDGMEAGDTIPELRDRLITDGISRTRANVIARTEVITVLNAANQRAAEGSRLLMIKTWRTLRDKRVRHLHRDMEGEVQDLDTPFSNGGMYPGDPELSAEQRIQCRCTATRRGKRDGNGRLMRK